MRSLCLLLPRAPISVTDPGILMGSPDSVMRSLCLLLPRAHHQCHRSRDTNGISRQCDVCGHCASSCPGLTISVTDPGTLMGSPDNVMYAVTVPPPAQGSPSVSPIQGH